MASAEQRADDRLTMRRALVVALALLVVSFGLFISWTLRNLLSMILVSVFVAVAFEPPVHFLVKRGWRRGLATGAVFVAAFLLALGFISALAPLAIEQLRELIASIPEIMAGLREWLVTTFGLDLAELEVEALSNDLLGYLRSVGGTLAGGLLDLAAGIGGMLIFATTVVLFSFYIVADLPQLRRTVLSAMPEKEQRKAVRVWDIAVENMGGYIYSRLLLAILSAALTTIVLTILDIPFALSLGIWVGVLSQFVPVVGTYLAAVLPAVVALTFNDVGTAVIVTIYFIGYQQIENYIVSPRITKRTMEIHPAVSVGAILAGAALMGGIGIILALPMTGIIQSIISESRKPYEVIAEESAAHPPRTKRESAPDS